ncbi:hypothetical protein A3K63_05185 [Candidatus Micrarchaeota archaeon RBG_16_49_10]|nr:MAG: hypothetical protein A3K63_05185 [Candidatus Micrarchaeota archaeon RBG_16_49_10]
MNNTPDNATTTSTSTTTSSTTTPASSGGGGGGGSSSRQNSGSTQESEGPDIVSISWPKLTPEFATFWEVSWQTPDTPIGVTEMKILVSREISNVSLSIERLEGPATSGKPSGKVYQYMDISKLNIDDLDISNVTMVFRVSKAWLEENGIDEDSVEISRYSNGWESLPVKRMGQDGEWFYYETSTPGFSVFAIHANQPAGASGTPLTTSTSTSSSTTTTTPIWTSKPKIAKYTILGLSVGLIVLAVLLILKGRKKEGN